jgi:hypothetical protein
MYWSYEHATFWGFCGVDIFKLPIVIGLCKNLCILHRGLEDYDTAPDFMNMQNVVAFLFFFL